MVSDLTLMEIRAHIARLELSAERKREAQRTGSALSKSALNAGKAALSLQGRADEWRRLLKAAENGGEVA